LTCGLWQISGFDRFAGIEGLRGCCVARAITSDRFPGMRTNIPPPLQYPVKVFFFFLFFF
jgi:aldehyde dehydrogenase (NAD+)